MKLRNLLFFIAITSLTVGASFFSGCSAEKKLTEIYSTNIKKLHQCYVMYMEDNSYRGPKDEAMLKDYLKTNPTAIHMTARIEVTPDTVDDIFISERDGEPFVVRYGLKGIADHAIVLEAKGFEGKRLVALRNPIEVDEATFNDYLKGKIKPERAPGMGAGQVAEESETAEQPQE